MYSTRSGSRRSSSGRATAAIVATVAVAVAAAVAARVSAIAVVAIAAAEGEVEQREIAAVVAFSSFAKLQNPTNEEVFVDRRHKVP
jgi:chorismate synthase